MQHQLSLKLLREVLSPLGWRLGLFLLVTIATAWMSLLPPELFILLADRYLQPGALVAKHFITELSLFGALTGLGILLSSTVETISQEWLRLNVEAHLRRKVLHLINQLSLDVLDRAWAARMKQNLPHVERFLTESLPKQVRQCGLLFGIGVLLTIRGGAKALIPLGVALLLAATSFYLEKKAKKTLNDLKKLRRNVFQTLVDSFEGIRTIRSHGVEAFIQRRFENRFIETAPERLRTVRSLGANLAKAEAAIQILITAALCGLVAILLRSELTLADTLFFPVFLGWFYHTAHELARGTRAWQFFFFEAAELSEVAAQNAIPFRPLNLPEHAHLEMAEVFIVDKLVIDENEIPPEPLDFALAKGELKALVGPSGCGKTVFLEALAGLRAVISGRASLLDVSGKELWGSDKNPLRIPTTAFAYLEQQPYLFEGTVRENLTFGNHHRISDTLLWQSLERVHLHHWVRNRGGLNMTIDNPQLEMNFGERYRLAFCRALLLKRPFLLLDEPFADLDSFSLETVLRSLRQEKEHTGILVLTHYLPDTLSVDTWERFSSLGLSSSTLHCAEHPLA